MTDRRETGTHPIEVESYRILAQRVDLSGYQPADRAVVARVVHASADVDFGTSLRIRPGAVAAGVDAINNGAAVVTDVEMTRSGISEVTARCYLGEAEADRASGLTRSAAAIRLAVARHPVGAIWVIGCAPTALAELLVQAEAGSCLPALVIALPVGFVGAASAKEDAWRSGLAVITNQGEKGGSGVAAAACNAVVRLAKDRHEN